MLKRILESTEGVDIYAIAGLIFFVFSFIGIVVWLFKADKNYLKRMKNLPLEDDSAAEKKTGDKNEIK